MACSLRLNQCCHGLRRSRNETRWAIRRDQLPSNFRNPNLDDCFFANQTSLFHLRATNNSYTKPKIETIKVVNYNLYTAALAVLE